ncbi:hypothetical protein [Myxococcus landrumensis]|uniref:Lipoprotein n=1 Tax=Myxococcus landrumensis TaxID=2813577 RepID=A0ABX7N407_9BACT|nr:hypothetical protein [Myxococcus landrumus]QSQ11138.1 hypothetical protein JY572_22230 [Myxococcus landrumus]
MNRLLLSMSLAVSLVLGACSHQGIRPPLKLGEVEDFHTEEGRHDGYSVTRQFDFTAPSQGLFGAVLIQGHGSRPIVVRPRPKRDEVARWMAPTLRISPIMMGPEDPRVEALLANQVKGLDYDFMRGQGWLYEHCLEGSEWLCENSGTSLMTPSFQSLDALVTYLGRWLAEGDFGGFLHVEVWRHPGVPEEVKTRMGTYDGYSVDWCKPDEYESRILVLTPTRTADALGVEQTERLPGQSSMGCHARFSTFQYVSDFAQLDEAILRVGRSLRDGELVGEVLLIVEAPYMVRSL